MANILTLTANNIFMTVKDILKLVFISPIIRVILRANYSLGRYRKNVWILGDGRSGTTWVSTLINYEKNYREMFEPFHPTLVDEAKFLTPHYYMRETDSNICLEKLSAEILTGKFNNTRVDGGNYSLIYKGVIIKDIFANLFAYWASQKYDNLRPVLLIRNPFSVALSKYKKKDWYWMEDPLDFLKQKHLYNDYLSEFEILIREVSNGNDYILKQILIWSIINYIPLKQFEKNKLHIVFYEDVFVNPEYEIEKIQRFINSPSKYRKVTIPKATINKPSVTVGVDSNVLAGTSPITSWKNDVTAEQIEKGLNILEHFGLRNLYDENSMPNRSIIEAIQSNKS